MSKRLTRMERQLRRQVNGHKIIITKHEMNMIQVAVEVYKRDHCDEFTAFEFQALLDDIEQIKMEWECEA